MAGKQAAGGQPGGSLIDRSPPRVLFAELVAGAIERTRVEPTPLATAYLVGLLDQGVRARPSRRDANGAEETLAEGLLRARLERGGCRLRRLRGVGDRALFVAGFFGDSLDRGVVGIAYYGDAGRRAYAELSAGLRGPSPAPSADSELPAPVPELFEELADRFADFVDVLTEVGDSTLASRPEGLAPLYLRFLQLGRDRDRRRLVRRGLAVSTDRTPRAQ